MTPTTLLRRWFSFRRPQPRRPVRRAGWQLQRLEDRTLPAVSPVSLTDPSYWGDSGYGLSSMPSTGQNISPDGQNISADGQLIAFESTAENLVPNDHNGAADVF